VIQKCSFERLLDDGAAAAAGLIVSMAGW